MENLKQRDFESKPFEVTCGPDCRLHIVGDPTTRTETLQTRRGRKGNSDGKDEAATASVKANIKLSNVELSRMLKEAGPGAVILVSLTLQARGGTLPVMSVMDKQAYIVNEVAALTGFSRNTVIRTFQEEKGVLILERRK